MKKIIAAAVLLALLVILNREFQKNSGQAGETAAGMASNESAAPAAVPPAGKGSGSALTSEEARLILALHNRARASVGTAPLTWSEDLARYAQEWADHLASSSGFEHRPESGRWKQLHGENLYMGTAAYTMVGPSARPMSRRRDTIPRWSGGSPGQSDAARPFTTASSSWSATTTPPAMWRARGPFKIPAR